MKRIRFGHPALLAMALVAAALLHLNIRENIEAVHSFSFWGGRSPPNYYCFRGWPLRWCREDLGYRKTVDIWDAEGLCNALFGLAIVVATGYCVERRWGRKRSRDATPVQAAAARAKGTKGFRFGLATLLAMVLVSGFLLYFNTRDRIKVRRVRDNWRSCREYEACYRGWPYPYFREVRDGEVGRHFWRALLIYNVLAGLAIAGGAGYAVERFWVRRPQRRVVDASALK